MDAVLRVDLRARGAAFAHDLGDARRAIALRRLGEAGQDAVRTDLRALLEHHDDAVGHRFAVHAGAPQNAVSASAVLAAAASTIVRTRASPPMPSPYRSIEVHISRLRAKLRGDPRNPRIIETIYGVGYMSTPAVEGS